MKAKILLLFSLIIISFYSCSSDETEEQEVHPTYLSKIEVDMHQMQYGEYSDYGSPFSYKNFNPDGTLAEEMTGVYNYSVKGIIHDYYKYTYDSNRRLVEKKEYSNSSTNLYKVYKYEYNSIDSISHIIIYSGDGDLYEDWTFEYGDDHKLLTSTEKDLWLSSNFGYKRYYTYEDRKIIVKQVQTKDDSLFGTTEYEYDSYGNLLSEKWTSGETGKTSYSKFTYTYTENGKISRKTSYDSLNNETYYDYSYNTDGSIDHINVSFNYKEFKYQLRYTYTWE